MTRWATIDGGSARVAIAIGDVEPGARPRLVCEPVTIEVGRRVPLKKPWTGWIRTPCEHHAPEDACECVRRYRPVQHTHKREVNDDDEDAVYVAIYELLQAHAVERVLVEKVGTVHGVTDAREMAAIAYDLIRTAAISRLAKDAALTLNIPREPSVTSQTWRAVVLRGVDRGERTGAERSGHTVPAEVMNDVLRREIDGCPDRPNEDERDALAMLAYVAMRERVPAKRGKAKAERPPREAKPPPERKRVGPSLGYRVREILQARGWITLPDLAALLGCGAHSAAQAVYRLRGIARVTEGAAHLVGVEVPPEGRGHAAGYRAKDAPRTSVWTQKCARCGLPRRGHVCAGKSGGVEPAAAE